MSRNVTLLLVVAGGLCLGFWIKRGWIMEGELREKIHARETVIAALARRAHAVDTAYIHDTVNVARFRTRLDTLLVDRRITDTMWVKAVVLAADSGARACSVALDTCARRVDVRDSIIAATNDVLALERKRRSGFRLLGIPVGCAAGVVASERGLAPGVGCGVRLK